MSKRFSVAILSLCLALPLLPLPGASQSQASFVRVADDHWHFQIGQQTFVPYGVNYTPGWDGWPTGTLFENRYWSPSEVEADFAAMETIGLNTVKLLLNLQYLLPGNVVDPERPQLNDTVLSRVDTVLEIAARHNLRVILTMDELGVGPNPPSPNSPQRERWFWANGGSNFLFVNPYNPTSGGGQPLVTYTSSRVLGRMWQQIALRYRDNPTIMAYSIHREANAADMWNQVITPSFLVNEWSTTPPAAQPQAAFNAYLHQKYATLADLQNAWRSSGYAPSQQEWNRGAIRIPYCSNNSENNPWLYDFQLFREWNTFRFFKDQVDGIRSVDPNHLVSAGLRPEFILYREYDLVGYVADGRTPWGCYDHFQPGGVPSYNAQELVKLFDYTSLHTYTITPPVVSCGNSTHVPPTCYKELRDTAGLQYRVMRLAARWSYNPQIPKPVLLDEFNGVSKDNQYIGPNLPPEWDNPLFSTRLMENLAGDVSGLMSWTWSNNPRALDVTTGDPDVISQSSGLVTGTQRSLTQWGLLCRDLKATIAQRVAGPRKPAARTIHIDSSGEYDKRWLLTSVNFQDPALPDTLFNLTGRMMGAQVALDQIGNLPVPDFRIESNSMIDQLMTQPPAFETSTPTATISALPSSIATATATATKTQTLTPFPSVTATETASPTGTPTWPPTPTVSATPAKTVTMTSTAEYTHRVPADHHSTLISENRNVS